MFVTLGQNHIIINNDNNWRMLRPSLSRPRTRPTPVLKAKTMALVLEDPRGQGLVLNDTSLGLSRSLRHPYCCWCILIFPGIYANPGVLVQTPVYGFGKSKPGFRVRVWAPCSWKILLKFFSVRFSWGSKPLHRDPTLTTEMLWGSEPEDPYGIEVYDTYRSIMYGLFIFTVNSEGQAVKLAVKLKHHAVFCTIFERKHNKYVCLRGRTFIRICRSHVHTPRDIDRRRGTRLREFFPPWTVLPCGWPIRLILGFWGAKFPKMGEYLPRTPMNRRAKFDAASFIRAGEIRNRTNTHKQTN